MRSTLRRRARPRGLGSWQWPLGFALVRRPPECGLCYGVVAYAVLEALAGCAAPSPSSCPQSRASRWRSGVGCR
eukprot:3099034-Alexandrium_andersonii.AAC.1